jgi:hypothetical protein
LVHRLCAFLPDQHRSAALTVLDRTVEPRASLNRIVFQSVHRLWVCTLA